MNKNNTNFFLLFLVVSLADLFFTWNGVKNGFLQEANFIIVSFKDYCGWNDCYALSFFKIIGIALAFWIAFRLPILLETEKRREKISLKFLLKESAPRNILLVLTIITAVLGAIPAAIFNFIYPFSFRFN